jgi:hypothetical protein
MVRLYFPRDIAQLRAAYQHDVLNQSSSGNGKNMPRTTLPLNLDTTGADGDSVSPYANLQTPLSQEAVLLGVVSNLKKHHIRFIMIRASNPLDTLFLCQFLRTTYPDAHIATIGSDLLYQRDFDKPNLHGVMSITSYPLLAGIDDQVARVEAMRGATHQDKVFSDGYSVGVFNALLSLVAKGSLSIPTEAEKAEEALHQKRPMILPRASYAQLGWPALSQPNRTDEGEGRRKKYIRELSPPLWLTVNGRRGAWPLALLDEDEESNAKLNPRAISTQSREGRGASRRPLRLRWNGNRRAFHFSVNFVFLVAHGTSPEFSTVGSLDHISAG